MRALLIWASLVLCLGARSALGQDKALSVLNWSDYIADDTVERFESETGIKVTYEEFDTKDALETRLSGRRTGFDVVVPTAGFLQRHLGDGMFLRLDKSRLANYGNLDRDLNRIAAQYDPGNQYAVPYLWGTTGIGFNVARLKERMPGAPTDSWRILFDPAVVSRFKDCGVAMPDSAADVIRAVLRYLGRDPNTQREDDIRAAEAHLLRLRPAIAYFDTARYIEDLANGAACLVLGWSGDVVQARARARDAGAEIEIGYSVPREGAMVWMDVMAIPADAPHPEAAHRFIDFVLRPEIAADIANTVGFANANAASRDDLDPELAGDAALYPPQPVKLRLFADKASPAEIDRMMQAAFERVKQGR
jgi:putrescine transport system substrate-binding protein